MRKINKVALMAVGDEGWMGGIQYTINMINALNELGKDKNLEVHVFKKAIQKLHGLEKFTNINLKVQDLDIVLPPFSFPNRVHWFLQRKLQHRKYPRLENYLIDNGFDYVYPALLSNCNGKLNAGAWIADFQYHYFPDGAHPDVTIAAERTIGTISKEANKVIFSSHFCEQDGHKFFPVSKGKSFVMPFSVYIDEAQLNAPDPGCVLGKYQLPNDFLVISNLFAPTKNHGTLFDALGILRKAGKKIDLVCTGNIVDSRNLGYANDILQMLNRNGIRDQVHLLGLVPREDQIFLYRMARGLVQPSLSEGWSTFVEEAKLMGKRLLLSDIEVHLEQNPGNPYFFKATDPADLARKINQLWDDTKGITYPEKERESESFELYRNDVIAFGENFLSIAAS